MNNQSSAVVQSRKYQHNRVKGVQSTKTTNVLLPYLHKLGEEQLNLNLKKQIIVQQKEIRDKKFFAMKKERFKDTVDSNYNIKDLVNEKTQEEKNLQQLKKNYSSHSKMEKAQTKAIDTPVVHSRQQKVHDSDYKVVGLPPKGKRREQFNKQSGKHPFRQQQKPSSKKTFRIKRVQNQNSKLLRDAVISLNQQQSRLQSEILQLHKKSTKQMKQVRESYSINFNIDKLILQFQKGQNKQTNNNQQIVNGQMLVKISQRIKHKKKQLNRIEGKIEKNEYLNYLVNTPQGIEEMNSSQEEDVVEELMPSQINQLKMDVNQTSYSTVMRNIKDKKYGLNLRRTYEVFKPIQNSSSNYEKSEIQQIQSENAQNKITVNRNLKDFLLN